MGIGPDAARIGHDRAGLKPILVPLASKADGIQAVRKTLPLCLFHPRTEEVGMAALEQYRREWDDEKKCFKANEVHDWTSHLSDAFRYLAMAWRTIPVHLDASIPTPKAGQTMLPPAPEDMASPGRRIAL
jgi:phage terminase large subunit